MYSDDEIKQIFAKRLKGLREAAGLSQGELAEKLGVSRGSISYYEQCQRVPDIVFLERVSSFFRVSVSFMMGYCENLDFNNEVLERIDFTDEAAEKLEQLGCGSALATIIEHERFEELIRCAEYYLCPVLHHNHPDIETDFDFRTFQIAVMITGILSDIKAESIKWGMKHFNGEIDTEKCNILISRLNNHIRTSDKAFRQAEQVHEGFSEGKDEDAKIFKQTRSFVEECDKDARAFPQSPDSELLRKYRNGGE